VQYQDGAAGVQSLPVVAAMGTARLGAPGPCR